MKERRRLRSEEKLKERLSIRFRYQESFPRFDLADKALRRGANMRVSRQTSISDFPLSRDTLTDFTFSYERIRSRGSGSINRTWTNYRFRLTCESGRIFVLVFCKTARNNRSLDLLTLQEDLFSNFCPGSQIHFHYVLVRLLVR